MAQRKDEMDREEGEEAVGEEGVRDSDHHADIHILIYASAPTVQISCTITAPP